MEEYLIPCTYRGDGYGISVMFAGLNAESYSLLEVSIDDLGYFAVERDAKNPYNSKQFDFAGLNPNVLYKVHGRFSGNANVNNVECNILSQDGEHIDAFDVNAIKRNAAPSILSVAQAPTVEV